MKYQVCLISQQKGDRRFKSNIPGQMMPFEIQKYLKRLDGRIFTMNASDGKEVIIDTKDGDRLFVCVERLDHL